jgi:hypothetical protein
MEPAASLPYSQQRSTCLYPALHDNSPHSPILFLQDYFNIQQEEESFHQQTGLKFKEETSIVLHLEHCFVWCLNVDTSENGSEVSGKF